MKRSCLKTVNMAVFTLLWRNYSMWIFWQPYFDVALQQQSTGKEQARHMDSKLLIIEYFKCLVHVIQLGRRMSKKQTHAVNLAVD